MTSLCGVWWCSNTIFYGQYPTQVKEELFLNDILFGIYIHSYRIAQRKFYGAITKRMNFNCPVAETSESIELNDNNFELNAIAYTISKIDSNLNYNTEYTRSFGDRELLASSSEGNGETEKKNTFSAVEDSTLLRWYSGTQKRVGRTKQKDQIDNEIRLFCKSIVKTKHQSLTSLASIRLIPPTANRVVRHICIWCIELMIASPVFFCSNFIKSICSIVLRKTKSRAVNNSFLFERTYGMSY